VPIIPWFTCNANVNVELVLVLVTARPAHRYMQFVYVSQFVHRLVTGVRSFIQ
jgi:hypothetical protein